MKNALILHGKVAVGSRNPVKELGEALDKIFNRINTKQAEGHFGLMTNKVITRTQGYRDGVIMALARFIQPQLF